MYGGEALDIYAVRFSKIPHYLEGDPNDAQVLSASG